MVANWGCQTRTGLRHERGHSEGWHSRVFMPERVCIATGNGSFRKGRPRARPALSGLRPGFDVRLRGSRDLPRWFNEPPFAGDRGLRMSGIASGFPTAPVAIAEKAGRPPGAGLAGTHRRDKEQLGDGQVHGGIPRHLLGSLYRSGSLHSWTGLLVRKSHCVVPDREWGCGILVCQTAVTACHFFSSWHCAAAPCITTRKKTVKAGF